jgi:peroxiredoxin Q/BCP
VPQGFQALDASTPVRPGTPYNQYPQAGDSALGVELMGFRTQDTVDVGSKAPNFTLPSQAGEIVSLEDFLGRKPVVLFFYPKDDTLGCTKQVCAFRDSFDEFRKLDAEVMGISSDPVESHRSFAGKHSLPFTLLSDEGGTVRKLYGVPNTFALFPGRVTYVIDKEGVVRQTFSSQVRVDKHVEEALAVLQYMRLQEGT